MTVGCGCGFFVSLPLFGGGGVGGGGLLASAACLDGGHFAVNFVGSLGGSIFAAVGSIFSDLALERALLTTTSKTVLLLTPLTHPAHSYLLEVVVVLVAVVLAQ